jgi:hypothetical protein
MPASKSSRSGRSHHGKNHGTGGGQPRHDATADAPNGRPVADDGAEDAEDVPMNRAERRAAKGKGGAQPRPIGKIVPGRTNLVHGPRSYANRRSGG